MNETCLFDELVLTSDEKMQGYKFLYKTAVRNGYDL